MTNDNKQIANVIGGAGEIGQLISLRLAEAGTKVAVLDLDTAKATEVADEICGRHGSDSAFGIGVDIGQVDSLKSARELVIEKWGPANILVNGAGWERYRRFVDTDDAYRRKIIEINLFGVFNAIEVFLPDMIRRKDGRIVNISSEAGRIGSPGESIYASAKAGVLGLTKTLAREHGKDGITVNAVCPGPIETPLLEGFISGARSPEAFRSSLERGIPMRRIGQPADVVGIVAFLAGPEAGYLTGEVVSVSGGLSMAG